MPDDKFRYHVVGPHTIETPEGLKTRTGTYAIFKNRALAEQFIQRVKHANQHMHIQEVD